MSQVINNGCFSSGWRDIMPLSPSDPLYYGSLINQEPKYWSLDWIDIGSTLYASSDKASGVPEIVHKLKNQLPPNEHQGGSDPLILCGSGELEATFKIFHRAASFGAQIRQTVRGLMPGTAVSLVAPMRIHDEDKNGNTWDAETGAFIVPVGGIPERLAESDYSGYWWPLTSARRWDDAGGFSWFYHGDPERGELGGERIVFTVPASGEVDVLLRVKSKYPKNIGFFIDGIKVEGTLDDGSPPPPPPPPPPGEVDEGTPREDYNRVYNVADPSLCSPVELEQVYKHALTNKQTVGPSFDDAGLGNFGTQDPTKTKTAVLWNVPTARQQEFIDWYAVHYPSTVVEFRETSGETPPFELELGAWPTEYDGKVTHWFGEDRGSYLHGGVDLVALTGSPVWSASRGVVEVVERDATRSPYGIHVWVRSDKFRLLYAHLQSALVVEGALVDFGSLLGYANNTGNSFGSHLHFEIRDTMKLENKGRIDPFADGLAQLWTKELDANGRLCWIWNASAQWDKSGKYGRGDGLNARALASSSSELLGVVPASSVFEKVGTTIFNGYCQVRAILKGSTTPPLSNLSLGVHMQADGGDPIHENDFLELKRLPLTNGYRGVKILTSHSPKMIGRLVSDHGQFLDWTVRVFYSFGGRDISPVRFIDETYDDLTRTLNAIPLPNGQIWLELHNEPNLYAEGLGSSWQNGTEFGAWIGEVASHLLARIPDLVLALPGLSPGGDVANVRQDSTRFLEDMLDELSRNGRLDMFDGLACHAYWSQAYPMTSALAHVDKVISMSRGIPVLVTEASNNKSEDDMIRARQYVTFYEELRKRSAVRALHYFVMSARDESFAFETWTRSDGTSKGIAQRINDLL